VSLATWILNFKGHLRLSCDPPKLMQMSVLAVRKSHLRPLPVGVM